MAEEEQSNPLRPPESDEFSSLDVLPLHSTDLLTLLDESGIVQYESPSIERLYGFDQDELVGDQVTEYFHPDDRERVFEAFGTLVASDDQRVETVEYRHEQADGTYKWIESVGSSDPTPEGHYVINSRDISARKQREQELQRTRVEVQSERDGKEAIRQLLLQTATDGEIAASTCQLLVDAHGYEAAWVVRNRQDGSTDDPTAVTVADHGDDRGFRVASGRGNLPLDEPTRRVLEAVEPVTATIDSADDPSLRDRLAECGLHSVRSVPLAHDGVSYGTLTVVRTDEASEPAWELVDELAAAMAFKRQVNRQREALVAESVVELDVEITGEHVLAALSTAPELPAGVRLSAEELRPDDEGLVTYLVKTSGVTAEAFESAAKDLDAVRESTLVAAGDGTPVVRLRVDPPTLGTVLGGHGGALQSITACDGCVDLTVQFARQTHVGVVVEAIRDHWPDATLRSRTERAVEDKRPVPFEGLTDKQVDALRAASLAGFFDRPQQASATDVAASLGVSRSTFLHHLRNAERIVFENVFAGTYETE